MVALASLEGYVVRLNTSRSPVDTEIRPDPPDKKHSRGWVGGGGVAAHELLSRGIMCMIHITR